MRVVFCFAGADGAVLRSPFPTARPNGDVLGCACKSQRAPNPPPAPQLCRSTVLAPQKCCSNCSKEAWEDIQVETEEGGLLLGVE